MFCPPILAFFDLGGPEILVIFVIILILFGGDKLPHLAKGLGKSIREFKKASSDIQEEIKKAIDEVPDRPAPSKTSAAALASKPSEPPPGTPPAAQKTEEFPSDGPKN